MKFTMRYGIDAPFWVAFLIIVGLVFTLLGMFGLVNGFVLSYGLICLVIGLWMFLYSTVIKVAQGEVILNFTEAKDKDELLDVGTGRGLLAILAAKRGCKVKAIDTWSKWDLSGNGKVKLMANIADENLSQIDVIDTDARSLPFLDNSFDYVVSNFVVHNIKNAKGRKKAIYEMWRVLRPGGQLVISDFSNTTEYVNVLNSVSNHVKIKRYFYTFPFSKVVIARKEDILE